jgi:hypothetical protein
MSVSAQVPTRFRVPSVSRWFTVLAVILLALALSAGGILVRQHLAAARSDSPRAVPQSAAMEQLTGVRFSRVAVVGDGGLITLSYVVLDEAKATVFQSNTAHPPKLTSESRALSTTRVSLMKQGHTLRTGQTYYLVYENTRAALRAGERVTIADGAAVLAHVPVL